MDRNLNPEKLREDLAETIRAQFSDIKQLMAAYEALGGDARSLGLNGALLGNPAEPEGPPVPVDQRVTAFVGRELAEGRKLRTITLKAALKKNEGLDISNEKLEEILGRDRRFRRGERAWWSFDPKRGDH